jgi:hypothetical protein
VLARLPDDCLIYYEPVVRRRYADLIAILPEIGVLVIELGQESWDQRGYITALPAKLASSAAPR